MTEEHPKKTATKKSITFEGRSSALKTAIWDNRVDVDYMYMR